MSNRKTTFFYALLIAIASLAVGMVLASRLGLSPESSAQSVNTTRGNSEPITGGVNATTFRDVAKKVTPAVVNIRTESRQKAQDLTDFAMSRKVVAVTGPLSGALLPRGAATVWADDSGESPRRDASTMPTARDAIAISRA